MTRFEIVEARTNHCGQMVRRLRGEHQAAIARLGVNTHRELRRAFDDSSYRRALLIDGTLAALGGVTGPAMAATGTLWLALAQEATRYPHHIARIARRQLELILAVKRELNTFILPADEASFRFAKFIGFQTLRNSGVEINEGKLIPMVIRRERKTSYSAQPAEQAVLH
jgi:hypothetical protein